MSETNWGEEGAAPAKKRSVPTWIWFCGGGCLAAVVLGVIAAAVLFSKAKEWGQAESQLPELAKVLPFDEPLPAEMQFKFVMPIPGMATYVFADERGYASIFYSASPGNAQELRDTLLNENYDGAMFGMGGRKDVTAARVRVQGREVKVVRFYQMRGSEAGGAQGGNQGQSAIVDLTPEGASGLVLLQVVRGGGDTPITDEELHMLLKPFHVGPDR